MPQTTPPTAEMPFLDHLEELRWRILWSLGALVAGMAVAFVLLLKIDLIGILARPVVPYLHGHKLVFTHPGDPFAVYITASLVVGVILALPVIFYQGWAFLSPALHAHERRVAIPILAGATLLFLSGVSLAYFVVLPLALPWLMGFSTGSLEPMITVHEYFDFVTMLSLAFGVAFELPIVILGLTAIGIVTPAMLIKYRRHAIVGCVFIGAFLTPGDLVWTTIAMAVPLYFLYELSILLAILLRRRRARSAAARDGGPGAGVAPTAG
jgi:sec-independent protein translocase protein TatC